MIETIELTPAVVGLGNLHEPALLALFADTHYRILTHGRTVTPREIASSSGEPLYPSVFAVHLHVPPERPLDSHALWHRFDLGVEVRTFGRQFLEVTGVLGKVGEVPAQVDAWAALAVPRVTWSSAWTVTRPGGEHELAMASGEFVGDLPRLTKVPAGIAAAREAFGRGRLWSEARPTLPVRYPVLAARDAALGRQMMFSQFVVVLDAAERAYLTDHVHPALPAELLDFLATRERRIFYFGNCRAGDIVEVFVTAKLARGRPGLIVRTEMELVDARTRRLLALADTEKVATIPATHAALNQEIERQLARHGEDTPLVEVAR